MIYQTVKVYRVSIARNGNIKIEASNVPYEFFSLPQAYKYTRNRKEAEKQAQKARELINENGVDYCLYNGILTID